MAGRSPRVPLYELMRQKQREAHDAAMNGLSDHRPPPRREHGSGGLSWLSPGRVLQIPVGYGLLGLAGVVLIAAGCYLIGYQRAKAIVEADYQQELLTAVNGGPSVRDPLTEAKQDALATAVPDPGKVTMGGGMKQPAGAAQGWGPIKSDPRKAGLRYFILAETTETGATRLAEFCRSEGLETYIVPSDNSPKSRWMIIAVPGFRPSDRFADEVQKLEQAIHRIGDKWKREKKGTTNLRDAYPKLFSG